MSRGCYVAPETVALPIAGGILQGALRSGLGDDRDRTLTIRLDKLEAGDAAQRAYLAAVVLLVALSAGLTWWRLGRAASGSGDAEPARR